MRFKLLHSVMGLLLLSGCGTAKLKRYSLPYTVPEVSRVQPAGRVTPGGSLNRNPYGLWELYVEGSPLELGLRNGALSDSLYRHQETVFFRKVEEIVPSRGKQWLLRKFLAWYNRKLPRSIIPEYRQELYGLSRYASDSLDFIAPPYSRTLYLHGAHDIGHALQDLAMVGCTSFAVWGENTEDGKLLIGRNFDFYAGDEFAENKVVAFVKPDSGYGFMSVSWPGMIGVVSGMNTEGLTVTINAGKSSIPMAARTPVSLLVREILQYARNIDEAVAIAARRRVFVSESIMVGSAADNRAILIEISPRKKGIFDVNNSAQLVCSNHFQSPAYSEDKKNRKQQEESHSVYRFERMSQLLGQTEPVNVEKAVAILRNRQGLDDRQIGLGNEKSLNHLLAHHGVVFRPAERKVWVSARPYQLGAFVAYDLKAIFSGGQMRHNRTSETGNTVVPAAGSHGGEMLYNASETLPEDPFLHSPAYAGYERYRVLDRTLDLALKERTVLPDSFFEEYIALNPELWSVYYKAGKYFKNKKQQDKARVYFETALTKEITTRPARREIEKNL